MTLIRTILFTLALLAVSNIQAASYYTGRLEDSRAVYLSAPQFHVQGDGVADDTDALQGAIDKVQETTGQGILFIPQARYRISKTVYIWPGIRLIGYGRQRPVLVLGDNTSGFQAGLSYMLFFAGSRPGAGPFSRGFMFQKPTPDEIAEAQREFARYSSRRQAPGEKPADANPGTFYSAMSNIDIEIGAGNPGAAALRAHYAQHCFLAHMDFHIGSGLTGIQDGGNLAEDLHFYGGQYGIVTGKPSPGWQFTVVDSSFEGQSQAAIKEHEAGLTLIRPTFQRVPTAIDPMYADELWMKDGRLEDISGPAVVISDENSPRTEINFEGITCRHVPVFASFRESGKAIRGPSDLYSVAVFSHGAHYRNINAAGTIEEIFQASPLTRMPSPVPSDVPAPPAQATWVNVQSLGVKGDGEVDDTAALQRAINAHRTLYFPEGAYRVTDTIQLRPDTVLIGLHPSATRIVLPDGTPAFAGIGNPKSLIEAPRDGTDIVMGLGLYTSGANPRAVAAKWMAGPNSLMNDVRFLGGHGTFKLNGLSEDIYNNTHTADPNPDRHWDSQYPSLWITNGGGGTFMDIWTPSTFAQAGMLISDTTTEGRVYQMSSEHHVRNEIQIRNASNWSIYALQTEEERGESAFALPLEIDNSSHITIANLHQYRVVSSYQPFPYAVKISRSRDIHFRNLHCYSDSKVSFDSAVFDETGGTEVRQREFAFLNISDEALPSATDSAEETRLTDKKVERLAGGFFNISGGAADKNGNLYFVDAHWQRIYRWSAEKRGLRLVRDNPLEPVNLAFDQSGNLLVISYAGKGTVYSFKPDAPGDDIALLKPEPARNRPGATAVVPVEVWRNEHDFERAVPVKKPYQFVSPDGTTFIPAGEDFVTGQLYYGSKIHDLLRAFGLSPAVPGKHLYLCDENEEKTYDATIGDDGSFSNLKPFAERGGEAVTTDKNGNVYIAAGQIYMYSAQGKLIDMIRVPERPTGLVFGGKDGNTLYVLARTSLYARRAIQ